MLRAPGSHTAAASASHAAIVAYAAVGAPAPRSAPHQRGRPCVHMVTGHATDCIDAAPCMDLHLGR